MKLSMSAVDLGKRAAGASTDWAQSAQHDTASQNNRPQVNGASRRTANGATLATTNGIAMPLEAELVLQRSELPALVTADLGW